MGKTLLLKQYYWYVGEIFHIKPLYTFGLHLIYLIFFSAPKKNPNWSTGLGINFVFGVVIVISRFLRQEYFWRSLCHDHRSIVHLYFFFVFCWTECVESYLSTCFSLILLLLFLHILRHCFQLFQYRPTQQGLTIS